MDYIEEVLGIKVKLNSWQFERDLPYYILDRYKVKLAVLEKTKAIFLYPKKNLDQIASVRKHIAKIQKMEALPVVIVLENLKRNQRNYLITAKIPFIVPFKQLYLPFMGIVLQEKFSSEIMPVEKFQPSAQVIFFYYLYQKEEWIYANELSKITGFSEMTVTRAVRQLEQTSFFETKKIGIRKVLRGKCGRRELFEKTRPYLISPIRKIIYVSQEEKIPNGMLSGIAALAEKSFLNPPSIKSYAVYGRGEHLQGTEALMDADAQIELELWRYDPHILGNSEMVDPLSLIMSFKNRTDERIEEAIEEIMDEIWEE